MTKRTKRHDVFVKIGVAADFLAAFEIVCEKTYGRGQLMSWTLRNFIQEFVMMNKQVLPKDLVARLEAYLEIYKEH